MNRALKSSWIQLDSVITRLLNMDKTQTMQCKSAKGKSWSWRVFRNANVPEMFDDRCFVRRLWGSLALTALMDVALHWSFPLFLGTSFALAAWTQNAKIFKVKESKVGDFYILHHHHKAFKVYMSYLGTFELFVFVESVQGSSVSRWGTDNRRLLKLLTQENVLVGGFFSISGYVAAYTTTNLKERGHDAKKFKEPELFFWQKVPHYILFHSAEVLETLRSCPKSLCSKYRGLVFMLTYDDL